jgi:GT2 family glycosyltransferase
VSGLSIVVVSWNTRALTLRCLDAACEAARGFARATGAGTEIVLVDNGSCDGTAEAVRARWPDLAVVALAANRGFAGGVNAGLARTRGDVVLLLNTDARIEAPALIACWRHLADRPATGIVGPRLVHADGRLQHSAHAFPSWLDEVVPAWLLDVLLPRRRPARWAIGSAPLAVDAVQGAALFVRRAVLEAVGPLDEAYFFYLEETDLCWRAQQAGFGVDLVPTAHVEHAAGASSKRVAPAASRIEYHRSLYRFLGARRGPGTRRLARGMRSLRAPVTVLGLALASPFSARARRRIPERAALLAWHWRGCPAEPRLGEGPWRGGGVANEQGWVEDGADRGDPRRTGSPIGGASG